MSGIKRTGSSIQWESVRQLSGCIEDLESQLAAEREARQGAEKEEKRYTDLWAEATRHKHELMSERDSLRAQLAEARKAMLLATQHGISGDWFCALCGYELKKWILAGATGQLPELCPLCRHAEDAAIRTLKERESGEKQA